MSSKKIKAINVIRHSGSMFLPGDVFEIDSVRAAKLCANGYATDYIGDNYTLTKGRPVRSFTAKLKTDKTKKA